MPKPVIELTHAIEITDKGIIRMQIKNMRAHIVASAGDRTDCITARYPKMFLRSNRGSK